MKRFFAEKLPLNFACQLAGETNAIVARLDTVRDGDVIIAHMNKPASDSAEGLSAGLDRLVARGFGFVKLGERGLVRAAG